MVDIHDLRDGDRVKRFDDDEVYTIKHNGNGVPQAYLDVNKDSEYTLHFPENWTLISRPIKIPEDLQVGDVVKRDNGVHEGRTFIVEKSEDGHYLVARSGGIVLNFSSPHRWAFVDRPLHVAAAEKPPLGLKPRKIHDEERLQALAEAITRYVVERKPVPEEWFAEYDELIARKDA